LLGDVQAWIDEFDEIGCGELDVDGFIRLCAEKEAASLPGNPPRRH